MHHALLAAILQETVTNQNINPEQAQHIAMVFLAIMPFIMIIFLAIIILPFWFICKKAGFSPWLSLLNIIPFAGNCSWFMCWRFADWKVVPIAPPVFAPPGSYPPQPPYPPQS